MTATKFKLTFKKGVDPEDFRWFTKNCETLFIESMKWFQDHDLEMHITSLISDRAGVSAKSRTHESGRAFDISVKNLSKENIIDFCDYLNRKFKNIAAISADTLKPLAAKYGDDAHLDHIHCQVRPDRTFT